MERALFRTNKGEFTAELYPNEAPGTVANFKKLIGEGFYDGIVFHRVIPDFVVQGGDPYTKEYPLNDPRIGTGGAKEKIKCETDGNPHRHQEGSLSMAHAGKNTGSSQFFIVLNERNTRHLDGVHTVFGRVVEGMDVVRQLQRGDRMDEVKLVGDAGA